MRSLRFGAMDMARPVIRVGAASVQPLPNPQNRR
jgi:hypothetical protein